MAAVFRGQGNKNWMADQGLPSSYVLFTFQPFTFYSADACDRCILSEEDWRMIVGADKESPSWLQVNFNILENEVQFPTKFKV